MDWVPKDKLRQKQQTATNDNSHSGRLPFMQAPRSTQCERKARTIAQTKKNRALSKHVV